MRQTSRSGWCSARLSLFLPETLGFFQLKLLPDSTTPHTPVLLGKTRLFPSEHDPSLSVLLTASQTPRRPTVPRRPFICFYTDGPIALTRLISSTTRALGAFHGISPEDAVQISCTAVSMPRTRNLWELVGPLAVLSSCKSVQAHTTAVLKVVSPLLSSSCCQ